MDNVNKTLYIPLYGKAYVSKKGILLNDKKAEEIWSQESFSLKGKSGSKWLAYYMGMRSAVFDDWLKQQMTELQDTVILHLGCGLDSRILRVGTEHHKWYDVDFDDVIKERKQYYSETANHKMIAGDVRNCDWLKNISETKRAVIVMEGVSMYLTCRELKQLMANLCAHFEQITVLMDCYTTLAAKLSKYKNPINDVGITQVYGIDDPEALTTESLTFLKEHSITPRHLIDELNGIEKFIFKKLYAGSFSKKLYRMYEFRTT
ncbi:MAG: class I SAM-dependent methyltransferase [Clostridia bacterium]|nr:class I SAM-dependent methyltransferase [Clostridia bacterium]